MGLGAGAYRTAVVVLCAVAAGPSSRVPSSFATGEWKKIKKNPHPGAFEFYPRVAQLSGAFDLHRRERVERVHPAAQGALRLERNPL